jgi:hypothetical protein
MLAEGRGRGGRRRQCVGDRLNPAPGIRDCLSGEGRDKAEGWCRATWRFRRRLYDGAKSIQAAETWGAISQLFATS